VTAAVLRKSYIVDRVQDYNISHDKAAHPVICEDCHFTHMWKTRACPHAFVTMGPFGPYN
jgi:hypothetical protein